MKLGWLNNVSGVYSVVFSLLLFGQHGLGYFFRPPALAPHWLEDFADGTPTKKKLTIKAPLFVKHLQLSNQLFYHR
jgi:hypothetical protein